MQRWNTRYGISYVCEEPRCIILLFKKDHGLTCEVEIINVTATKFGSLLIKAEVLACIQPRRYLLAAPSSVLRGMNSANRSIWFVVVAYY